MSGSVRSDMTRSILLRTRNSAVAMAVALYAQDRLAEFDDFVFTVVAAFLVYYVCYFVFPPSGPRVPKASSRIFTGWRSAPRRHSR